MICRIGGTVRSCYDAMNLSSLIPALALLVLLPSIVFGEESFAPDRRKDQFSKEPGYYVFPMPYSIPGVGAGAGVVGMALNVADSHTDLFGYVLGGGLTGEGVGVADCHLVPETLILDLTGVRFGESTITSFKGRG